MKIIEINENTVMIVDSATKQLQEVRLDDFNFTPRIGDEVDVFTDGAKIRVLLSDHTSSSKSLNNNQNATDGGINITIENSSSVQQPTSAIYVGGKVVNKITYCLLAFFLGGIGAQKFYSGKTGAGIVCLIFCWTWIPSIIGVIDAIIGLAKTADSAGNIVI